jgi:hypothetical protein
MFGAVVPKANLALDGWTLCTHRSRQVTNVEKMGETWVENLGTIGSIGSIGMWNEAEKQYKQFKAPIEG